MHEDAVCQHHRDSTYTVPYVSACPICAGARPLIRRGVESPDGDLALPCPRRASASPGVASEAPQTLRVSTPRRTLMRPKAAHEFPRMKSQSPLLYSFPSRCGLHRSLRELRSIRLGISILCPYGDNYSKKLPDIRVAPGVFVCRACGGIRVLAGGESPQG